MKPKLPYQIRKKTILRFNHFWWAILISHLAFNHFKANTESDFPKLNFQALKS